ncbi:hypothetical protein EG329_010095 [Mollisiaceae sp. DMI_Dod_QoI]|nr:hypothetical protein EG329_010095 [Helotiales sp. DMI_Dod_QoI]
MATPQRVPVPGMLRPGSWYPWAVQTEHRLEEAETRLEGLSDLGLPRFQTDTKNQLKALKDLKLPDFKENTLNELQTLGDSTRSITDRLSGIENDKLPALKATQDQFTTTLASLNNTKLDIALYRDDRTLIQNSLTSHDNTLTQITNNITALTSNLSQLQTEQSNQLNLTNQRFTDINQKVQNIETNIQNLKQENTDIKVGIKDNFTDCFKVINHYHRDVAGRLEGLEDGGERREKAIERLDVKIRTGSGSGRVLGGGERDGDGDGARIRVTNYGQLAAQQQICALCAGLRVGNGDLGRGCECNRSLPAPYPSPYSCPQSGGSSLAWPTRSFGSGSGGSGGSSYPICYPPISSSTISLPSSSIPFSSSPIPFLFGIPTSSSTSTSGSRSRSRSPSRTKIRYSNSKNKSSDSDEAMEMYGRMPAITLGLSRERGGGLFSGKKGRDDYFLSLGGGEGEMGSGRRGKEKLRGKKVVRFADSV